MYQRIINFVKDVEVNDAMSDEEKDYILEFCENKLMLEYSESDININKTRAENIKNAYINTKLFKNTPDFEYGNQIGYEMEEDLIAMKWAIYYLSEYLEYRDKIKPQITFGDRNCNLAFETLINRVLKYSCASNLKEELRKREVCKFKDICKYSDCL